MIFMVFTNYTPQQSCNFQLFVQQLRAMLNKGFVSGFPWKHYMQQLLLQFTCSWRNLPLVPLHCASLGFSTCWAGAQLSSQHSQHFRKAAAPNTGSKRQTRTTQFHTNHGGRGSPDFLPHSFQQCYLLTSSSAQIYTEVQSSSTSSPRSSIVMQIPVTFFSKPGVLLSQMSSGSKVSL